MTRIRYAHLPASLAEGGTVACRIVPRSLPWKQRLPVTPSGSPRVVEGESRFSKYLEPCWSAGVNKYDVECRHLN